MHIYINSDFLRIALCPSEFIFSSKKNKYSNSISRMIFFANFCKLFFNCPNNDEKILFFKFSNKKKRMVFIVSQQ
jgi:hypothetical protein